MPVHIINQSKDTPPDSVKANSFLLGYFHGLDEEVQQAFKVMTYNWGGEAESMLEGRSFALEAVINNHNPDMICLQDVTPQAHQYLQKFDWWKNFFCSLHVPKAAHKACYHLQMGKFPVEFSTEPFANSAMHMGLSLADNLLTNEKKLGAEAEKKMRLVLATCIAEEILLTMDQHDEVPTMECIKVLVPYRNAILYNVRADAKFCLPNDDWVNAWHELQLDYSGKTDPFFCKMTDYKLDSIEIVEDQSNYVGKCNDNQT